MNCTHRREDDKKPVCIHTMFTLTILSPCIMRQYNNHPFIIRLQFIQKPFTQTTLFLHVFPIYFNHRQLEIAATQKRLQDFFHNTRADKKLSALLPFNNTFKKTYHPLDGTFFHDVRIHWGVSEKQDPAQAQKEQASDKPHNQLHGHILVPQPSPQASPGFFPVSPAVGSV